MKMLKKKEKKKEDSMHKVYPELSVDLDLVQE